MPSLEAISDATIPIQKIATSRCTVRFLPNGDSSLQNQYGWSGLSLAYRLEDTISFIHILAKLELYGTKTKKTLRQLLLVGLYICVTL